MVARFIDQNTSSPKEDIVNRYFYPHDAHEILKIKLPARNTEDVIAGHYEKTGLFTVRSAYKVDLDLIVADEVEWPRVRELTGLGLRG